jgi:hypothetical protein
MDGRMSHHKVSYSADAWTFHGRHWYATYNYIAASVDCPGWTFWADWSGS